MYIICSNCGNDKYWGDYGPTECYDCGYWNTEDGTDPVKNRCISCGVSMEFSNFKYSDTSNFCDQCYLTRMSLPDKNTFDLPKSMIEETEWHKLTDYRSYNVIYDVKAGSSGSNNENLSPKEKEKVYLSKINLDKFFDSLLDQRKLNKSEIKPEPEIKPKEIKVPERVQRQFEL